MEKGLLLEGRCTRINYLGKGVFSSFSGEEIIVPGMVPGDEGLVEISYKRGGICYGKLKKLSKLSPDRIEPLCPIHSACGGCLFHNMSYERQLRFKKELVESQLSRVKDFAFKVEDCVPSEPHLRCRNKASVPFGRNKKGRLVCGFYKEGSHDIVPFSSCVAIDQRIEEMIKAVEAAAIEAHIPPYDEETGRGILRHVSIRKSRKFGEVLVTVVTRDRNFENKDFFFALIKRALGSDDMLVHNWNPKKTNVILGDNEEPITYSAPLLRETVSGVDFLISSKSFFQTNVAVAEKLYDEILRVLDLTGTETILDAYGGIGSIGLVLAEKAKKVVSVEWVKEATEDAKINAQSNGITNFYPINADVGEYLKSNKEKFDVVVLDPARKGCGTETMEKVRYMKPERIVYVSCSPMSLAKDIETIKDDYEAVMVKPFDMFPFTAHVETLVLFKRKTVE